MYIHHSKASIFRKDLESVLETMLTDRFGPSRDRHIREFEKNIAEFMEIPASVVVNSGTAAMHLSLMALGVGKDDEILVPSYSEPAILNAAALVGARPVICDINHKNFGLNHDDLRSKLTPKAKLIYVPHLFGFPVDISVFQEFNLPIMEDVTDSLGAEYKEKKVGTAGTLAVASFTDEKMITTGQGGAIFSTNKTLIQTIRSMVDVHGQETFSPTFDYRMCDLLAALGMTQLKYLARFIEKRQVIAAEYAKLFAKYEMEPFELTADRYNTCFRYIVMLKGGLQKTIHTLRKSHVEVEEPIAMPLHKLLGLPGEAFPNAELAWRRCLSIPIYPTLKKTELERIVSQVYKSLF